MLMVAREDADSTHGRYSQRGCLTTTSASEGLMPDHAGPDSDQEPGPKEPEAVANAADNDPGPIEVDVVMKSYVPPSGDPMAGRDLHLGDVDNDRDGQ
jgi:hypothetical protein